MNITKYSDKSFVLRGNTKLFKDDIRGFGGKWNRNLKKGGPGWIFPNKKLDTIKEFVSSKNENKNSENEESDSESETEDTENEIEYDSDDEENDEDIGIKTKNLVLFFLLIFFIILLFLNVNHSINIEMNREC